MIEHIQEWFSLYCMGFGIIMSCYVAFKHLARIDDIERRATQKIDNYFILREALIKIHDNPYNRDLIVEESYKALSLTK